MSIEQNLKVSLLLEIYGKLLTQKQQDILSEFFNDNISLSEIAETHNSSRQAVNDLIKRSVKILEAYEQKLGLLDKFNNIKAQVNQALANTTVNKDTVALIEVLNKIMEEV